MSDIVISWAIKCITGVVINIEVRIQLMLDRMFERLFSIATIEIDKEHHIPCFKKPDNYDLLAQLD